MKKTLLMLSAMLLLTSVTACGANNDESNNSTIVDSQGTADGAGEVANSDNDEQTAFGSREFNKSATIEETVLVDEYDVKITATELNYGDYEVEVALVIENNSDKDLSFVANSAGYSFNSVNGYMVLDGYLYCDVAAGKKAMDSISIDYDTLMLYGIFEIADIEIGFDISDSDYNHTYTGPRTIQTTAFNGYNYETPYYRENIASKESQAEYHYSVPYFSTAVAYEENGLVIASQGIMENQSGEKILLLEVANTSDDAVGVSTTNIDINELRVCNSTWSYDTINPGKTAIVDVNLSSVLEPEYWDVYGIAELGNVSLKVYFKDDEWDDVASPAYLSVDIPGADATFSMNGTEVYNANGIQIISKGIYADPLQYSDDMHVLMVAKNNSGRTLTIDDVYDSLSVNEYMTSYSIYTTTMEDGDCAMVDVCLYGYGLEDIGITELPEIQSVEFSLVIRDQNYKEIDEATILIETAREEEWKTSEQEEDEYIETEKTEESIRPEFKEAMDSYEAFYTEYCEFMEEYSENPTDLTLLAKYADMLVKAEEMNEAFEEWDEEDLSNEELQYYLEVNNRVMKMLVDVAS